MKIIIDGPNNVGKSTLIQQLNKTLKYPVLHIVKNATFEVFKQAFEINNVIFDRGPISELVYSEIYGRKSNLTLEQVKKLLNSPNVDSYILIKPKELIYENYKRKHEEDSNECTDAFIDNELELFEKYALVTNSTILEN